MPNIGPIQKAILEALSPPELATGCTADHLRFLLEGQGIYRSRETVERSVKGLVVRGLVYQQRAMISGFWDRLYLLAR